MTAIDKKAKPTILIIDDDESMRFLIARHMTKLECDVIISDSGEKAIEYLQNEEVALILTDLNMPGMDGIEMLSHIKHNSKHSVTPVIFISGNANEVDIQIRGYKTGAVDFLQKPYNPFILQSKVKVFLDLYNKQKQIEFLLEEQRGLNQKLQSVTTELDKKNRELDHLSRIDPLTHLPNRRDAREKMQQEVVRSVRNKDPFSVIIADVDHFKMFNDTYGHEGGDNVLVALANTIKQNIRSQDYVCRWGGEEFLFLLPETDRYGAKGLAEKIRLKVEQLELMYHDQPLHITMSFGIGEFNRRKTLEEVVKTADDNLYRAKDIGRNCVFA